MTTKIYCVLLSFMLLCLFCNTISAQKEINQSIEGGTDDVISKFNQLVFFDYRGTNTVDFSLGASTLLDNVDNTEYGFYAKLGYKRFLVDHLSLGVSVSRYNLNYSDIKQDLISFDFNLEFLALPYNRFSPYLYGGFGYNASDDFNANAVKVQGGLGLEYIIVDGLGVKLFGEYNYSLDNEMSILIFDQEDDVFLRVGLGVNLYFGGDQERKKRLESIPTQIKSNPILPNN